MQAARPALFCLVLLSLFSYCSCHSSSPNQGESSAIKETATPGSSPGATDVISKPDSTARYTGVFSGSFGDGGIITLVLNYISGKTVSGYDVHKGLRRNVNGEATWVGGRLHFVLNEPGDNRFDGTFDLLLDTASRKMEGEWIWDNPSRVVARHENIKLAPMQWDESAGDGEWNHGDTALDFHNNGTCRLEISPENEHAQLIVVRGNFDKTKDAFIIEWEKNPYIAASAKMVEYIKRVAEGSGDSAFHQCLQGGGMELIARREVNE